MEVLEKLTEAVDELNEAFAAYKQCNDEKLKALEDGAEETGELREKIDKIDKHISDIEEKKSKLEARLLRPSISEKASEYSKAFSEFLRKGETSLNTKAMSNGVGADGGYAVPTELSRTIYDLLQSNTPMRSVADVISVDTPNYYQLVGLHGTAAGWVDETDARSATSTSQFAKLTPTWGELYSVQLVSQYTLDDAFFDIESWLAKEVAANFAISENAAFTTGSGTKMPIGFLSGNINLQKDKTRPFGTLQAVKTGVSGAFGATNPADILFNVMGELNTGHLNGARWMMNRNTLTAVRGFKDENGQYLWQPSLIAGEPSTLCGYEVTINDDMPDIAADSYSIAFGNFKNAYVIADRKDMTILRDPYSSKPSVQFYFTKRVGSFLRDSEAIKLIKFGA